MSGCTQCGAPRSGFVVDTAAGKMMCSGCGTVQEENMLTEDAPTALAVGSASGMRGRGAWRRPTLTRRKEYRETFSLKHSLDKAREQISDFAYSMGLEHVVSQAVRVYNMAIQKRMLMNKKFTVLCAACLYVGARLQPPGSTVVPMLVDFCQVVTDSPHAIGSAYEYLVANLHLNVPTVDPSMHLPRYVSALGIKKDAVVVIQTTMGLVAHMNRAWIVQGRQPAGVVAAALYLACRMHGYEQVRLEQVTRKLAISDKTVLTRLEEIRRSCPDLSDAQEAQQQVDNLAPSTALPVALERQLNRDALVERYLRKRGRTEEEIALIVDTFYEPTIARGAQAQLKRHDGVRVQSTRKKLRSRLQRLHDAKARQDDAIERGKAAFSSDKHRKRPSMDATMHGDSDSDIASDDMADLSSCTLDEAEVLGADAGEAGDDVSSSLTETESSITDEDDEISEDSIGLTLDWYYVYLKEKEAAREREKVEMMDVFADGLQDAMDDLGVPDEPFTQVHAGGDDAALAALLSGATDDGDAPLLTSLADAEASGLDINAGNLGGKNIQDTLQGLLDHPEVGALDLAVQDGGDDGGDGGGDMDFMADLGIDLDELHADGDGDENMESILASANAGIENPHLGPQTQAPQVKKETRDRNNNYVETMELGEANFDGLSDVSDTGFDDWIVRDEEEVRKRRKIWEDEYGEWAQWMRDKADERAQGRLRKDRQAGKRRKPGSMLMPQDDHGWDTTVGAISSGLAAHTSSSQINYANLENLFGKLQGVVEKERQTDMAGVLDELGVAGGVDDAGVGGDEDFGFS